MAKISYLEVEENHSIIRMDRWKYGIVESSTSGILELFMLPHHYIDNGVAVYIYNLEFVDSSTIGQVHSPTVGTLKL